MVLSVEKWSDQDVEAEILRIETLIKNWAVSQDLWHDSGFVTYLDHVKGEPTIPPTVTIMYSDGGLINHLDLEFIELLNKEGYTYENRDGVTAAIYSDRDDLSKRFEEYFHWKWVCSLIKADTADVYSELYSHFLRNPEHMHKLKWRDFEVLLFRIFQNHGYKAILGPGSGDEGVDITLWQESPLGDVMTLVQAKKYAPNRMIDQTQVAALYGVGMVEKADNALFVTTSNYAPVAKRFAARTSGFLELANKEHIVDWCKKATAGVIQDKSSLLNPTNVTSCIEQLMRKLDHRLVQASWGYNMTHNSFAIVIKETKYAALLIGLRNETISDDGYGQRGTEVPILHPSLTASLLNSENVRRVMRMEKNGDVSYWDGSILYTPWNGKPAVFDYLD